MGVTTVTTDCILFSTRTKLLYVFKEGILWLLNTSFGCKKTGKFRRWGCGHLFNNLKHLTKELVVILLTVVLFAADKRN
jgi:hypothetical protein